MSIQLEGTTQWFAGDIESTGVYANTCRLLSFAAIGARVNLQTKVVEGPYSVTEMYFKQVAEVPSSASAVHGLTRAKLLVLSKGLTLEDQQDALSPFIYGGINLIGHNINYDRKSITNNVVRAGLPFPIWGEAIDTLAMARKYWTAGRISNHQLGTCFTKMCEVQKTPMDAYKRVYSMLAKRTDTLVSHDAGWDSFMALKLFSFLLSEGVPPCYATPLK